MSNIYSSDNSDINIDVELESNSESLDELVEYLFVDNYDAFDFKFKYFRTL